MSVIGSASRFCIVPAVDQLGEVRLHCEYLHKRGIPVLVLVNAGCTTDYSDCADEVVRCEDIFSASDVVASLYPYRNKLDSFASAHDRIWPAIFGASDQLGIPFPGIQAQVNCRIKPKMRELLQPIAPLNTEVISLTDLTPRSLKSAVERVGMPFVIKPIWGQGSDYVSIVRDESRAYEDVYHTFSLMQEDASLRSFRQGELVWDARQQLLLEEFAPGREFSLEGFIRQEKFVPLMMQEKYRWAEHDGLRFETGNLCPTPYLRAHEKLGLQATVQDVLGRLGLDNSFFHIEFKWDGRLLNIVEVNPRMGGGSVPAALNFWFESNVREMELDLRMGEVVGDLHDRKDGFLLGVFVNALETGIVDELTGVDWARSQPEFGFETFYSRMWQFIPPRQYSKAGREAWMYCYDVFYWCQDDGRIDYLHDETRTRVRVKLKTEREISEGLARIAAENFG